MRNTKVMKDIKNQRDHQRERGSCVRKKYLRVHYMSVTAIGCRAITVNVENYQRTGKGGTPSFVQIS